MSRWLGAALLAVAVIAVYWSSLGGQFVLDDVASIVSNESLRGEGALVRSLAPPDQAPNAPRWRGPVVTFSLALNYRLGDLKPSGYHILNLLAHLAASLLLFDLLRRTFLRERARGAMATDGVSLAFVCALLWAVHPLLTDSVTYVIQRTTLFMGLFYLATLDLVIAGAEGRRARVLYTGAVVCCWLGMLSKEAMVTAPVLVLLYDRVFLVASWRELWQQRRWLYAGLAGSWLALGWLVAVSPHPGNIGLDVGIGPFGYLLAQAPVLAHYLRLVVWPTQLILDYGAARPIGLAAAWAPGLVLLMALVATALAFRRHSRVAYLGAWFFLILAPTSSVVPIVMEVGAERRMYLPLVAVVVLLVLTARWLLGWLQGHGALALGWRRLVAAAAAVLLAASALGSVTVARNLDYKDPATLWAGAARLRPLNSRAHNGLGVVLAQAGRLDEAVKSYQRAVAIDPGYAEALYNLGSALNRAGEQAAAFQAYERTVALDHGNFRAHNNLGNILLQMGRPEEAALHFREVTRLDPGSPFGHNGLGLALGQLGRYEEAERELREALRLRPDYTGAAFNLATVLQAQGRLQEAIAAYKLVLRLDPKQGDARRALQSLEGAGEP